MLGASAGGAAAAGISGFVSGAGTSLLAGGNLKDSLKAGAIGGITAGVSKGVMNRMGTPAAAAAPVEGGTAPAQTGATSYGIGQPSPITRSGMGIEGLTVDMGPGAAPLSAQAAPFRTIGFQGDGVTPLTQAQFDRAMQAPIRPSASPVAASRPTGTPMMAGRFDPNQAATLRLPQAQTALAPPITDAQKLGSLIGKPEARFGPPGQPDRSLVQQGLDKVLPSRIKEQGTAAAEKAYIDTLARTKSTALAEKAYQAAMPGMIRQYAPLAATGLGIMALGGGFDQEEVAPPEGFEDFMSGSPGERYLEQNPDQRIRYGGVNTTSTTPQFNPYSYTPPPRAAAKGGSMDKGFPRKTGPINGPGTGTSDDIPAMLSDGEFVFTAKAVRNMGDGSRRKGAQRMYALMRKLEGRKNG
jgi:hypothetical protein